MHISVLCLKGILMPTITKKIIKDLVLHSTGDVSIIYLATVVEIWHLFGLSNTLGNFLFYNVYTLR